MTLQIDDKLPGIGVPRVETLDVITRCSRVEGHTA